MHFSKILVTTDLSEASFTAFDVAAYEQKMEAAEIRLLYVYQYFHAPVSSPDLPTPPIGIEFHDANKQLLQKRLDSIAAKYFHGQNVISEVVLSINSPADTICWYALEHSSELIITASKGQTALKGLLLGSTVQRVLVKTACPVLIVPVRE